MWQVGVFFKAYWIIFEAKSKGKSTSPPASIIETWMLHIVEKHRYVPLKVCNRLKEVDNGEEQSMGTKEIKSILSIPSFVLSYELANLPLDVILIFSKS